jgi:serine/threonine protein kinase
MNQTPSYKLISKIGQGGMAEVYKAVKTGPDGFSKTVALKKILPFYSDESRFIRMLSTEARINSYLNHPNIVQILDFFEDNGQYAMVLEFVDGRNLKEIMTACRNKNIRLPWQACVYIVLEVLKGLHEAHNKTGPDGMLHIVHRDISPHNILISFEGHVKLTDFGIARARIERDETASGVLKGKYRYLSPEQILNEELTPSSDLFSLGVTFFEMLTFEHPFGEVAEYQILKKIVDQPHSVLNKHLPELKNEISSVVEQSLQKIAADRYQSANDFYEDLMEVQDPQWISHGREKLQAILRDAIPPDSRQEQVIEPTSIMSDSIRTQHSLLDASTIHSKKTNRFKWFIPLVIAGIFSGYLLAKFRNQPAGSVKQVVQEEIQLKSDPQPAPTPAATTPAPKPTTKVPEKSTATVTAVTPNLAKTPKEKQEVLMQLPEQTDIYVNGKKMDVAPNKTIMLEPGTYMVLLQNDQGKKIKTLVVSKQQKTKVTWE